MNLRRGHWRWLLGVLKIPKEKVNILCSKSLLLPHRAPASLVWFVVIDKGIFFVVRWQFCRLNDWSSWGLNQRTMCFSRDGRREGAAESYCTRSLVVHGSGSHIAKSHKGRIGRTDWLALVRFYDGFMKTFNAVCANLGRAFHATDISDLPHSVGNSLQHLLGCILLNHFGRRTETPRRPHYSVKPEKYSSRLGQHLIRVNASRGQVTSQGSTSEI